MCFQMPCLFRAVVRTSNLNNYMFGRFFFGLVSQFPERGPVVPPIAKSL